jgi:hypothetical protein
MTQPVDDDPLNITFNSLSTDSYDLAKYFLSGNALNSWSCTNLFRMVTRYRNFFTVSGLRLCETWAADILSCRPTFFPVGTLNCVSRRYSKSFVARITSSKSLVYCWYEVEEYDAPMAAKYHAKQRSAATSGRETSTKAVGG